MDENKKDKLQPEKKNVDTEWCRQGVGNNVDTF